MEKNQRTNRPYNLKNNSIQGSFKEKVEEEQRKYEEDTDESRFFMSLYKNVTREDWNE